MEALTFSSYLIRKALAPMKGKVAHLAMKESIDKGEGPRIRWLGDSGCHKEPLCSIRRPRFSAPWDRIHQKAGRFASNPGLALMSCLSPIT